MNLKAQIINTLKAEVVPALGCTEPVAVALACAKARELINNEEISNVNILVSPNIYKNGLCVGIPYTDEVGLQIAGALGIVGGKPEKELQVLEKLGDREIQLAKEMVKRKIVCLEIKDTQEKVYVEVTIQSKQSSAKVIISEKHNQFVYLEQNGTVLLNSMINETLEKVNVSELYRTSIFEIIAAIESIDWQELAFLLDGLEMNAQVAKAALENSMGMGVGRGFLDNMNKGILSDDLINYAMMLTAAGADARMSGAPIPVMSSNGSGNHGLTAILPIAAYQKKFDATKESYARALAISHIVTGYIKHYTGRLSALCGCGVAAATGASVAIAWLMGADEEKINGTIKNMVANIAGMVCDGAKVGCALKLATAAATAIQSALLAMQCVIVPAKNGIVGLTAEESIKNLGQLGIEGMTVTDDVILGIMQNMQ
ncbi:serine dehydratase subunit alpha family protein [Geosporobacter ferrireducens]|uniref:L-cysteine desulfidase family protein n=1 Tax=Geosporobacter ferrireducens TaxID=1424294 RepID=UPI00139D3115|nr:L-serine ammonia-lyase, iron-sulfur-dependent, subunit alpha [Geosporobacter ferrireducens]MTI56497.1 serine dehydratase subunit alpha family protein [Geosporobacter ferrireducens]